MKKAFQILAVVFLVFTFMWIIGFVSFQIYEQKKIGKDVREKEEIVKVEKKSLSYEKEYLEKIVSNIDAIDFNEMKFIDDSGDSLIVTIKEGVELPRHFLEFQKEFEKKYDYSAPLETRNLLKVSCNSLIRYYTVNGDAVAIENHKQLALFSSEGDGHENDYLWSRKKDGILLWLTTRHELISLGDIFLGKNIPSEGMFLSENDMKLGDNNKYHLEESLEKVGKFSLIKTGHVIKLVVGNRLIPIQVGNKKLII
jgi:hypothetical protein